MTVEQFIDWAMAQPRGKFELYGGRVVQMSPERVEHIEVKGDVFVALRAAVREAHANCHVLTDGATLKIDAFPNQVFTGKVTRISNSAIQGATSGTTSSQQAVDFEVIITLDAPPAELRPDLSATAERRAQRRHIVDLVLQSLRLDKRATAAGQ